MDVAEAEGILEQQIAELRKLTYSDLKRFADGHIIQTPEAQGASGIRYYLEIQTVWDGKVGPNIRVIAAIDDGGIRALRPVTRNFIKAPDGSFVGE